MMFWHLLRRAWRLTPFERLRLRQLHREVERLRDECTAMVGLIEEREAWQVAMVQSFKRFNMNLEHPTRSTIAWYAVQIDTREVQIHYIRTRIWRRRLLWLIGRS